LFFILFILLILSVSTGFGHGFIALRRLSSILIVGRRFMLVLCAFYAHTLS